MRMSQVLTRLAEAPGDRITIRTIFAALSDRSFALLIVLLGLPNCLPMPPPIPAICALLLMLVALQIGARRASPWLPGALMNTSIKRTDLGRAIQRALPLVTRLERWSRPRLRPLLFDAHSGAVLGAAMLIAMAFGMLAAVPFIGQVPYGLAVCLIGLGQAERDGLLILSGLAAGLVGALLSVSFVYAVVVAIRDLV